MGQYYRGAILSEDYKTVDINPVLFALSPYEIDNGAKLMEHSYVGNFYVNAYMRQLSDTDGVLFDSPFVWVGDYADEIKTGVSIYHEATEVEKLFKDYLEFYKEELFKEYKYIVNFDKNEYIVMPIYKEDVWEVHPLPLLTAFGNGRGGGDYQEEEGMEYVGRWAFDHIGVTNDEKWLEGKTEIKVQFKTDF